MEESSTRKVFRIKKDRISELPQNLRETILGFLPMEDAVRTSILSTKWRHCWTMIPNITFDEGTVANMMDKFRRCNHSKLRVHKFACVINTALLLHNGPIDTFSLTFPKDCLSQIIHDYIDQWIPLFSRKGIKKLILEKTSSLQKSNARHFSSLNLTHLKLTRVWFPYTPAAGRFSYLTILELVDATKMFGKSFFDCPVLEKLTLILCKGLFPNNFRAPNLKCLHHVCRDRTWKCSLVGFENLAEYSFLLPGNPFLLTNTSNLVKVLNGVHKLKKFSIAKNGIKYLAAGGSPNRLAKPLTFLKTLSISCINFKNLSEVPCLLCLIRSAPNLCELNISTKQDAESSESDSESSESESSESDLEDEDKEGNLDNYSIEDPEDWNMDRLENVTFSYFGGLKTELELVKFLLAHSPSLKTMFIHRSKHIESGVALKMADQMLQYSRASSRAQIRPLKCPIEVDEFDKKLWDFYKISRYH